MSTNVAASLDKTETATRVRGRIEKIIDWAIFHGHRNGDNPARWKGNLELLLQKPAKIKTQNNHPALMLSEASVWYAKLRSRSGIATLALEFCTLTAARSGEVRGATWSEIEGDLWILPAKRTKTGQEHRIPLSSRSIEILAQMPKSNAIIFPNTRGGKLSDAALSACMKRINNSTENGFLDRISGRPAVPHGLRSTFRD